MYPLSKASDNLREALHVANETAAERGSAYVGSEHFIYAFLSMPNCSAYGILAGEGVTKDEYGKMFFKTIDENSKLEGLTPRTKSTAVTAAPKGKEPSTVRSGKSSIL